MASMIMRTTQSLFLFGLFFLAGNVACAQEPSVEQQIVERVKNSENKNFVSLSVENDSIGGGTDQFYTSGVRLSWFNVNTPVPPMIDEMADMVPTFDLNETTSTLFTLGQNIYTPEDIRIAANQDNDRPWAAFLYGSVGLATLENNHIDELEVTLGIVGPEALGEQAQKFIHSHVTSSPTPKGWRHQLDFEPGLIISAQRRWPGAYHKTIGDYRLRAEPNVNASLGNIYTYIGSGVSLSFGPYQGYLQDTPPRVRPAMPGSGYFETPDQNWSWYLFAGLDGRLMGHNIFLDGNTFKSSHSVDKKPFVGDVSAGVAFTLGNYRLSYAINGRSKEFDGQKGTSVFGSLTLSTRF
ncbi:MAG TPA: lipid A deacylase LpxR family protein [Alphaproteobacteria bacterium]|nr:lipid A deacylase LpxR family protein [Alphaproteobacteria bacterium]